MGIVTYHKLYTIDFDCYSFLSIKKTLYKEIWPLSTFGGLVF